MPSLIPTVSAANHTARRDADDGRRTARWEARLPGTDLTFCGGGAFLVLMTVQPLRLYDYAASCNCYKVRLLLAHLGRTYERVSVDIFDGETLTEEYGRMNPMRTTPVLEVRPGRYLPESNAILVYLARGSQYLPEEPFEFAQVVRWLIYEQTDVVPMIGGLRFRLLRDG